MSYIVDINKNFFHFFFGALYLVSSYFFAYTFNYTFASSKKDTVFRAFQILSVFISALSALILYSTISSLMFIHTVILPTIAILLCNSHPLVISFRGNLEKKAIPHWGFYILSIALIYSIVKSNSIIITVLLSIFWLWLILASYSLFSSNIYLFAMLLMPLFFSVSYRSKIINLYNKDNEHYVESKQIINVSNPLCRFIAEELAEGTNIKTNYIKVGACCEGDISASIIRHVNKIPDKWIGSGRKKTDATIDRIMNNTCIHPECSIKHGYGSEIFSLQHAKNNIFLIYNILKSMNTDVKILEKNLSKVNKKFISAFSKEIKIDNFKIFAIGTICSYLDDIDIPYKKIDVDIHSGLNVIEIMGIYNSINNKDSVIILLPENHMTSLKNKLEGTSNCHVITYDVEPQDPTKTLNTILQAIQNVHTEMQ